MPSMLQLDNKYCEVSFLHFSGSKRNMSEAFCLVQCFVECIQLQNKDGQKRIIDKVLKKHLNIMVGSQQPLFFVGKNGHERFQYLQAVVQY